jgi:hypothetical protein
MAFGLTNITHTHTGTSRTCINVSSVTNIHTHRYLTNLDHCSLEGMTMEFVPKVTA